MAVTVDRIPTWLDVSPGITGTDIVLLVHGGIVGDRAEALWAAIEETLEWGEGRRVIVVLTHVTGFDTGSIHQLAHTARTVLRRHDDLRVVLKQSSALDHYIHCNHLDNILPLHYSLADAQSAS